MTTRLTQVLFRHPELKNQAMAAITVKQTGDRMTAVVATHFRSGEVEKKHVGLLKTKSGYHFFVHGHYGSDEKRVVAPTVAHAVEMLRAHHFPCLISCSEDGCVIPEGVLLRVPEELLKD